MYKYFEQVKYTLCSRSSAGVCGGGGVKVYYYLYIEATLGEKAIVYTLFIYSKLNPKQTLQILVLKYKCI